MFKVADLVSLNMSRDMRFPMGHVDKCRLGRACAASFLNLKTLDGVRSVS